MTIILSILSILIGTGSISLNECVSPVTNIVFGISASAIAVLCSFTVFFSSSQKSSFLRTLRIVTPIHSKCKSMVTTINNIKSVILRQKVEEIDAKVINSIGSNSTMDKVFRIVKCVIFFVGSIVVSVVVSFVIYFLYLASIFYSTFILWVRKLYQLY